MTQVIGESEVELTQGLNDLSLTFADSEYTLLHRRLCYAMLNNT